MKVRPTTPEGVEYHDIIQFNPFRVVKIFPSFYTGGYSNFISSG
jgi:hypothetical protein